jgi:RimJ/RimL family protein N-acetyltransferase
LAIVASDLQAAIKTRAGLSFRPVTLEDARLYADLTLGYRPDEPADPLVAAYRWSTPSPGFSRERFIVNHARRPVGFAWHLEASAEKDPDGHGKVEAFLVPEAMTPARLRAVYDFLEERAAQHGVRIFNTTIFEDEEAHAAVLLDSGYQDDYRAKAWELDLVKKRDRLLLMASRAEMLMRELGIVCRAVGDDPDPEIWSRVHEAHAEALLDIPHTAPIHAPDLGEYLQWVAAPDIDPRWYFIAKDGERVVGISFLTFPPVQGNVWTGFTGVVRSHRGRGIARGVKLAVLRQAVEAGVERVRTDNDERNAPMLHINEELGYHRIPGFRGLRKLAPQL